MSGRGQTRSSHPRRRRDSGSDLRATGPRAPDTRSVAGETIMDRGVSTGWAAARLAVGAAVSVMAASVMAACAPQSGDAAQSAGPAKAGGAAPLQAGAVADCADAAFDPMAPGPASCRLSANGGAVALAFQSGAGDGPGSVRVTFANQGGEPVQTLTVPDAARPFAPEVDDVNGDGTSDLLVQTDVGNVNWVKTVLLFDGAAGAFVTSGVISGFARARTADGLLAVQSRSSAAEYAVSFYRFDALRLAPVATATIELGPDGARTTCSVAPPAETPGSFGGLSLSAGAAQAKFCSDPAAQP